MTKFRKVISFFTLMIFTNCMLFPGKSTCITVMEEEKLSHEFLAVALTHLQIIEDPFIENYINKLGRKILASFPRQPFKYRFYVVKEEVFNAFAAPAGHVFIHSGLIEAMDSEDELAGILGHEISHVACRHISDMIERSKKTGLVTLAGIAAGIFLGVGGAATAGTAVTMGSIAAGQSAALSFSRENEMQADQIGLKYLYDAGYNCKGLLKILGKIRNKDWFGSDFIPTYLKTHPATEERISYIGSWIERNQEKINALPPIDNTEFIKVRTKINALYGDENLALNAFKNDVEKDPENSLAHYGYGLVLFRTGNLKEAAKQIRIALEKDAFDPNMLRDLGKIYYFNGQYPEAMNVLESALKIGSFDHEGLYYLGRTKVELGMFNEAITAFDEIIAKRPNHAKALYSIGETYYKLENPGEAHYYLGIYYKYKKDIKNTIFHLEKALKTLKNPEKKEKVKEMLDKIKKKVIRDKRLEEGDNSPGKGGKGSKLRFLTDSNVY